MITIIIKDGIVVYGPRVALTAGYADGGHFRDTTTRIDNAEQISVEALPPYFVGGCYTYADGAFSLIPERADSLPVPQEVRTLQALLAIDELGHAAAYEAWSNDPARTFREKAFVQKAEVWKRNDSLFNAAADGLGFTEADKDAFFRLAALL